MSKRIAWTFLKRGLLVLLVLLLALFVAIWWLLRGSLPPLDGELAVPGLSAPVTVGRDALGVVTIEAANENDAMRALGYVHAQERYFEMDLLRRTAAGELAELFGPIAIDTDKEHRVHRMRARVVQHLDSAFGRHRTMAQAYTDGINAGLGSLKVRPWPYLLLRKQPAPWRLEDTALTGYAMYFDLQDSENKRELAMSRLRPHLPGPLYDLLARDGTSWDAPIAGRPRGDAALPDALAIDLRKLPAPASEKDHDIPQLSDVGSNNFAVSGEVTRDGRAIIADDMHLGLRAPNIWFRARLRYADARAVGGRVDATGFTLPGLPALVVGSNGQVAWGFTNSYGDWLDWQQEPACPAPCTARRTYNEHIRVAGQDDVVFPVEETAWGPILHRNADGTALSLRWVAHLPGSLTLGLADFLHAHALDDALAMADDTAIPGQNLVIGDRSGRIAWRLLGPAPQRQASCDSAMIMANGSCAPWTLTTANGIGLRAGSLQRLWTANARVVDDGLLARIGDGGYANGARARQIRDDLFSKKTLTERDLLAIQLDDRALFLARWWQLLREQGTKETTSALHSLAQAADTWQGRASADSVSYRIVRAWRQAVHDRLLDGLTAPAQAAMGDDFTMPTVGQFEGVAWPLVTQRPMNLLPRRFANWDALFEDAAREVRDDLAKQGPLAGRTWGERNTAKICHPLAMALPGFAKPALCMPADPLPGDSGMPRVQGPNFGASERMVVSPGHEADGITHMPGGQSGHPLSPFWGAGHDDWVHGRPTPFLPGQTRHALTLSPAAH
ncbi:penicillin acylase family protein [Lysobacter niastensis]|uniref:Penicillin acylase family protein n=1 Tax=Lysobacter niastensis TaxID=380629 RepID=A0ABS0B3P0_9GAMM|nr:penicillin acylase family protein [Lysobacter niastensis]MBF6022928.1 penicillin acylase family protein [Lysobacter niastensis]